MEESGRHSCRRRTGRFSFLASRSRSSIQAVEAGLVRASEAVSGKASHS